MNRTLRLASLALTSVALLAFTGCGGGSDSVPVAAQTTGGTNTPATANTPAIANTIPIAITVVDGPIQNATVCLDKNLNGVCDIGEPTGKTDATGKVTLQVDVADAGKYPVLAEVKTDAIDMDRPTTPITVPFTLKTAADKPAVVSPLTTLVQSVIETTGLSSAAAETQVRLQTGLNVSLFEDFSKSTSTDSATAGTVARMLVVTTQQQASLLGATVGGSALDGVVIKQADLNKIILNKLLEILPALLTALSDPSVQNATGAAKEAALLTQATALITSSGLTTASVATLVAINNQTSSTAPVAVETPAAGAALASLTFNNAASWVSRVMSSSLSQATADAAGSNKYVERRQSSVASVIASWGFGGNPARGSDLHWNGLTWANCAINFENTQSVRDAKGNNTYNYCDSYETGKSNRASFDASGRKMIDVYNEIIAAGYTNLNISSASSVLGTTTFPTGSKLFYQTGTPLTTAIAYYPGGSNYVGLQDATLASGNTAACNAKPTAAPSLSATLTDLVAVNKGTPCVFGTATVTGSSGTVTSSARNEAWGQSTLSLGTLGTAPTGASPTTSFYTTNTMLTVGFGSGNVANYYSCQQRYNGFPVNCNPIGSGTFAIQTLGDAKTLSFAGLPAQTSALTYNRVFVESGGHVYLGYQNKPNVSNTARLNLTATNAMFTQLGVPTVSPETPLALTQTSYVGEYRLLPLGNPGAYVSLFINANGTTSSTYTNPSGVTGPTEATAVTFTNLATGAFTSLTTGSGATGVGTANFLTGVVNLSLNDPTSTPPNVTLSGARR